MDLWWFLVNDRSLFLPLLFHSNARQSSNSRNIREKVRPVQPNTGTVKSAVRGEMAPWSCIHLPSLMALSIKPHYSMPLYLFYKSVFLAAAMGLVLIPFYSTPYCPRQSPGFCSQFWRWLALWLLTNPLTYMGKYTVKHSGRTNLNYSCTLYSKLIVTPQEKNQGVSVDNSMRTSV